MKITTKEVREVAGMLDDIIEQYKKMQEGTNRNWRTYEQQLELRIRIAMKELEPLIDEAISSIQIIRGDARGRQQTLTPKQKVTLLLLKHLARKSNRDMSFMLVLFSLLSGVDVSYKTVERLYSDEETLLVLHNMHGLILKKKEIESADCTGDGTGYSLTIKKHYATEAQKLKNKAKKNGKERTFVYSFYLMDLANRMYIAYGTSFRSEKEAYDRAMQMVKETGIRMDAIRLDKYYSSQKCVKELERMFGDVTPYIIPKTNATIRGTWKWKRMLHSFVNDTFGYLHKYFEREQSESGFSEDKRRFGWRIPQRREDRIDTAALCTLTWHNLFWLE